MEMVYFPGVLFNERPYDFDDSGCCFEVVLFHDNGIT